MIKLISEKGTLIRIISGAWSLNPWVKDGYYTLHAFDNEYLVKNVAQDGFIFTCTMVSDADPEYKKKYYLLSADISINK